MWTNNHEEKDFFLNLTFVSTVSLGASFATRVIVDIATACPNVWTPWRMVAEQAVWKRYDAISKCH